MGLRDNCAGDELEYRGRLSGQWLVVGWFGVKDKSGDAGARQGGIDDG